MNFRTEYNGRRVSEPLDVSRPVVLLGSCFTTSIGERMRAGRWRAYPNPCGVLYNPMSIAMVLETALSENPESVFAESVVEREGRWVSWLTDSKVSGSSPEECVAMLTERFSDLKRCLAECSSVIITFGTSWIYELADSTGCVVANCHKFPEKRFVRRRLSPEEISERWRQTIGMINECCGRKRFIFTVSPIRHLRDGFEGNSVSKAALMLACADICRADDAVYFPSFEIMNDDLRDYRFYASDMAHPSEEAVDYVWDFFKRTYLDDEGLETLRQGEAIYRAYHHRPNIPLRTDADAALADSARKDVLRRWSTFNAAHHGAMLALSND